MLLPDVKKNRKSSNLFFQIYDYGKHGDNVPTQDSGEIYNIPCMPHMSTDEKKTGIRWTAVHPRGQPQRGIRRKAKSHYVYIPIPPDDVCSNPSTTNYDDSSAMTTYNLRKRQDQKKYANILTDDEEQQKQFTPDNSDTGYSSSDYNNNNNNNNNSPRSTTASCRNVVVSQHHDDTSSSMSHQLRSYNWENSSDAGDLDSSTLPKNQQTSTIDIENEPHSNSDTDDGTRSSSSCCDSSYYSESDEEGESSRKNHDRDEVKTKPWDDDIK